MNRSQELAKQRKAIANWPEHNLIEVLEDGTVVGDYWENLHEFEQRRLGTFEQYQQLEPVVQLPPLEEMLKLDLKASKQLPEPSKPVRKGKDVLRKTQFTHEENLAIAKAFMTYVTRGAIVSFMRKQGFERDYSAFRRQKNRLVAQRRWKNLCDEVLKGEETCRSK